MLLPWFTRDRRRREDAGVRKPKVKPDNTLDTILQAGQLVGGKYRVDYLLGEGGMAAVWAGTNERTGKRVALKVILRSLATTREAQGLFQREALAASRVNHPNVVTVFDVIEHEGMACIVMELLDGEPLGSYLARKGFLTVGEATSLLSARHARGGCCPRPGGDPPGSQAAKHLHLHWSRWAHGDHQGAGFRHLAHGGAGD